MLRRTVLLLALGLAAPGWSQEFYTWTDEDGVHYTDDPASIPKEKKAAVRKTQGAEIGLLPASGSGGSNVSSAAEVHASEESEPSEEQRWRAAFSETRRRIDELKLSVANDRKALENTPPTVSKGGRRMPSAEYEALTKRIADEEAAQQKAEADLVELERKAGLEGVPREWRKEPRATSL